MAANEKGSLKEPSKSPSKKTHPSTSREAQEGIPSVGGSKQDFSTIVVNENLPVIDYGKPSSSTKGPVEARAKEDKSKYDSSRCKCCEKPLNSGANCMPTVPKFNRCSSCNGYVCRHCRGECHECIVRKDLILEPEDMLHISRSKLIGMLQTLHYPKHHFDTWEKQFLIKQILTRFDVHREWTPRPSSVISQETIEQSPPPQHTTTSKTSRAVPLESRAVPLEAKQGKSKISILSKIYSTQASTSSQIPKHSSTKSGTAAEPGLSKGTSLSTDQKGIQKSKSSLDGSYKDLKLVIDDLPEAFPTSSQRKSKREEKGDKKSRKESNISSTSTVPLTNKLENPQEGSTDKGQKHSLKKPDAEPRLPKFGTPKLLKKAEITKSKDSISIDSTPTGQRKVDQMKIMDRLDGSLKDISCLKDIDELPIKQIRSILNHHSFDIKEISTEEEMRYTVKRIWRFKKDKENEAKISQSMEDVKQNGKELGAMNGKQRSKSEHQFAEASQDHGKKVQETQRKTSKYDALRLETLSSIKSIEHLDANHLSGTLRHHNIDPDKYKTRQELVYAVQCLWHAIHAQSSTGVTVNDTSKRVHKKTPEAKTALPVAEADKGPVAKIDKFPSISNIRSVTELERLSEDELREILARYSIDPGMYTAKHELYYGVLLLWNSRKVAAKEAKRSNNATPTASGDQKTEYVRTWLLKNNDIPALQPATEVHLSENKQQPLQHTSSSDQVLKMADNSAAIQQLTDQQGQASRQVLGSTPVMGTLLDVRRKQQTTPTSQGDKNHDAAEEKPISEVTNSKMKITKASVDIPKQAAKIEEQKQAINSASGTTIKVSGQISEKNNSASGVIYSKIVRGSQSQTNEGPKKVVAKLERQADIVYAKLAKTPQNFPAGDTCSSIISFGERIAPRSTELEFAYIDDALSEMSVNQGTRNERKSSNASSYYSKLLDVQHAN